MILSMTGYAGVQRGDGEGSYSLEIKSVNNRYFKASIKLPDHLSLLEGEVEKLLRARVSRGSLTFTLRIHGAAAQAYEINTAALQAYLSKLTEVKTSQAVRIDLATILELPGVCQPPGIDEAERQRQWTIIAEVTNEALDQLIEMRRTEGRALREDLLKQCATVREYLGKIVELAPGMIKDYHQKLLQRANELISEAHLKLALDDVKREVALYAERCDVNEETSRLSSHLGQFATVCDSREPAGRKLEFLAQEMLREANTIGSKNNNANIAHHVVEIKGAIDRLKEQVQNVE